MESQQRKSKVEDWLDNPQRILVGGLTLGIGGFLTYKLVKNIIEKSKKDSAQKHAGDDVEVQQAMLLRNAMNPSGISWMMSMDTSNTSAIMSLAKKITKLDKVITAYKDLYNDNLISDLQSELTTEEYQKFLTLMPSGSSGNGGGGSTGQGTFAKKGQMVVAKKQVFLRSTPDASYHDAFYESSSGNNILLTAKSGDFLGYSTGKQQFDEKNNVKFIQLGYVVKKDGLPDFFKKYAGQKYTFWVSSSSDYVDIFDFYKHMFEKYPSTESIVALKKPLDFYALSGFPSRAVVSTADTMVMNENLKPFVHVRERTLLGEYLGELDTKSKKYIRFRTVDNKERWADASHLKIIEK